MDEFNFKLACLLKLAYNYNLEEIKEIARNHQLLNHFVNEKRELHTDNFVWIYNSVSKDEKTLLMEMAMTRYGEEVAKRQGYKRES
ncbi:MAG: hypothetical protein AAGI23_08230 [Bacteroidota bacterium]